MVTLPTLDFFVQGNPIDLALHAIRENEADKYRQDIAGRWKKGENPNMGLIRSYIETRTHLVNSYLRLVDQIIGEIAQALDITDILETTSETGRVSEERQEKVHNALINKAGYPMPYDTYFAHEYLDMAINNNDYSEEWVYSIEMTLREMRLQKDAEENIRDKNLRRIDNLLGTINYSFLGKVAEYLIKIYESALEQGTEKILDIFQKNYSLVDLEVKKTPV